MSCNGRSGNQHSQGSSRSHEEEQEEELSSALTLFGASVGAFLGASMASSGRGRRERDNDLRTLGGAGIGAAIGGFLGLIAGDFANEANRRVQLGPQPSPPSVFSTLFPPSPADLDSFSCSYPYKGDGLECRICMDSVKEGESVRTLSCLHSFHAHCCEEWLKHRLECPICKHQLR